LPNQWVKKTLQILQHPLTSPLFLGIQGASGVQIPAEKAHFFKIAPNKINSLQAI
jgi:hypothetical protein